MAKKSGFKEKSFLEVSEWSQGVKARLPVLKIKGSSDGPLVVITAGQHGRELNGIAAIEKVFNQIDPTKLKGTIVFLPVMNPIAVLTRRQDYPMEEFRYRKVYLDRSGGPTLAYNMDRCWIDKPSADTYTFAITQTVMKTWLKKADLIIDLHGWSSTSISLVWGYKENTDLVRAFGLPWLKIRERKKEIPFGMILNLAQKTGKPKILVCELTPQSVLNPVSVEYGVRGITNSLKFTGMLEGEIELPPIQYEMYQESEMVSIISEAEGLIISEANVGDFVKKGQVTTRVVSLETFETLWSYKAPFDGLIYSNGRTTWGEDVKESSICYQGFTVGRLVKVENIIENHK
ncbi:succinylglutamate desuccinylase/aspartoacylase family protein [bacterium]|nr:succinylglutamate desuccinylase/aspartoacylase family protein [bacterium]